MFVCLLDLHARATETITMKQYTCRGDTELPILYFLSSNPHWINLRREKNGARFLNIVFILHK